MLWCVGEVVVCCGVLVRWWCAVACCGVLWCAVVCCGVLQTSSNNVQEIIESKVEKRTKGEAGRCSRVTGSWVVH